MVEWIISNKEWIFSGLGIAIISAFFAILKTNLTEEKQQSNIKIVDISLNEDKEFIVDIKLRNIGDQVAYIKEISFDILDYYNMINPQMTHYRLVESSHTYDVVLGKEKQQVFNVSQSIGANEVDRFQVKLASSIAETRMVTIYYLTLSIIYDEDNKVVKSEKYLWAVPSISEYTACYISHTSMEIAEKNYLELKNNIHSVCVIDYCINNI